MRSKAVYIICSALLVAACLAIMSLPQAYKSAPGADTLASSTDTGGTQGLPMLNIATDGQGITTANDIWCNVSLAEGGAGAAFSTPSTIRVRGQSSAFFSKKSFSLEFFKESGGTAQRDVSVLGMGSGHDWILHGPYLDKTLMRNSLAYHIARESMFWAPDTRYCELTLDGEYQGVYLIVESPRVSRSRINFADYSLLSGKTPYLLQRNRPGADPVALNTYGSYTGNTYYSLFVRYPVDTALTDRQIDFITEDISFFERALYADYFADDLRGYKAYIDMDSFVTYYIINEFSLNLDAGYLSTYCAKDITGKLLMGPVWDFNNAFDNYVGRSALPGSDGPGFVVAEQNWFKRLMQDRAFVDAVVEKYRLMREGILSDNTMLSYIDETQAYLGDAVERNFALWAASLKYNALGSDDNGKPRDVHSNAEAIAQLKGFIVERGAYLDANIELLYNNCIN